MGLHFLSALLKIKIHIKFTLASLKTLIQTIVSITAVIFCSVFPSLMWSIFYCVHSWPAFGTIFRITAGFWSNFLSHRKNKKAGTSFRKTVTGRILKISK